MVFFLMFVPALGLLVGAVARALAVNRGWVTGRNSAYQKWVVLACILLWMIGPFLWSIFGPELVVSLFRSWILEQSEGQLGKALELVWGISALPFFLLGVVLGWGLAPESSVLEDRLKKKQLADDPFANQFDQPGEEQQPGDNPFTNLNG